MRLITQSKWQDYMTEECSALNVTSVLLSPRLREHQGRGSGMNLIAGRYGGILGHDTVIALMNSQQL